MIDPDKVGGHENYDQFSYGAALDCHELLCRFVCTADVDLFLHYGNALLSLVLPMTDYALILCGVENDIEYGI